MNTYRNQSAVVIFSVIQHLDKLPYSSAFATRNKGVALANRDLPHGKPVRSQKGIPPALLSSGVKVFPSFMTPAVNHHIPPNVVAQVSSRDGVTKPKKSVLLGAKPTPASSSIGAGLQFRSAFDNSDCSTIGFIHDNECVASLWYCITETTSPQKRSVANSVAKSVAKSVVDSVCGVDMPVGAKVDATTEAVSTSPYPVMIWCASEDSISVM